MNKKAVLEYIRTIIIALMVALVLASAVTAFTKIAAEHHSKMKPKIKNTKQDTQLVGYMIGEYEKKVRQNPNDYTNYVKLGELNSLMFNYKEAEKQYKEAINKSTYGVYSPYFGLAEVYVKMHKFKDAQKTVKKIKNKDDKALLNAKGDFYTLLGDEFWQYDSYNSALKQYKIALFYYKKVDSSKTAATVNAIIDCYNKIASQNYLHHKIEVAISNLETALLYKDTPIINYKLAILYQNVDIIKSVEYMEKVFAVDPAIINYSIYERILIQAMKYEASVGNYLESDLYQQKYKMIKQFKDRYIFDQSFYGIEIVSTKIKKNLFGNEKTLILKFKIKNKTKEDLNTLFLLVDAKYNGKKAVIYNSNLFSKKNPLKPQASSERIDIEYKFNDENEIEYTNDIVLDFKISKKSNMRKISVFSFNIPK